MKYHTLSFSKIKIDVAKVIVYCSWDWRFKGSIIHMSLNVMCMGSKAHNLLIFMGCIIKMIIPHRILPRVPNQHTSYCVTYG